MSVAAGKFITTVMVFFPAKFESDTHEEAWTDSMIRNLQGYSPDVLRRAAQKIIDTRDDKYARRFPLPAECKQVCDDIIKWDHLQNGPKLLPDTKPREGEYDFKARLADELIIGPMGRQAAKEGWILSLHDFIRDFGRLPKGTEIDGRTTPTMKNRLSCKQAAEEFNAMYDEVLRGRGGACAKALEGLGDKMVAKREKLRRTVLGDGR
jgi:hypothetical protein